MDFHIFSILVIWILKTLIPSEELSHGKSITAADTKSNVNITLILSSITSDVYILMCENTEPIMWKCPGYYDSYSIYFKFKKSTYIPLDKDTKFGITLVTIDKKIKDLCFCVKNSTNDKDEKNALLKSIFAYRVDDKHIFRKGDTFLLTCFYKIKEEIEPVIKTKWILPNGTQVEESLMYDENIYASHYNYLPIRNAVTNQSGDYTCQILYNLTKNKPEVNMQINTTYNLAVMDWNEYFEHLNLYYSKGFHIKAKSNFSITVKFRFVDSFKLKWTHPNGKEIKFCDIFKGYQKYCTFKLKYKDIYNSILSISDPQVFDSGIYTAEIAQQLNTEQVKFNLIVEDTPIVSLEDVFVLRNEKAYIHCKVQSYPKALVTLTFAPCSSWRQCSSQPIEITSNITTSHDALGVEYIYNFTLLPKTSGIIRCKAENTLGTDIGESQFIVRDTNDNMTIYGIKDDDIKFGDSVTITCAVFAYYFSNDINWYNANGHIINETENIAINNALRSYYYTKSLTFKRFTKSDQGHYECQARLKNSENTKYIGKDIIPIDNQAFPTSSIAGISSFVAILIGSVIYICIRVKQERNVVEELKAAGLANFEEGAVGQINPDLTFDEQADLLPYDRRFEFPRDKIKLGMQLGAGAFGVVFKAYAEGIQPNELQTVVAVKMVKRDAQNDVIKALVSELKIMVHLGRHLNVVQLLGAVTKNIAKRELMVIVEYCHYGNVRNFLICNRKRFINQIDANTGNINTSIIQNMLDQHEINQISDNTNSGSLCLSDISMTQSNLNESQAKDIIEVQNIPKDVDDGNVSNNYINRSSSSNFRSDSTDENFVTTTDLISWAFQLASGMEYLSSMNVLHGDLAARNILLCKGYIVKICDFGLARSMYKCEDYKKQGDAMLPIKWLALESLSDQIFSTYTDVWSFGIVMWELFSLATVPYPNIHSYQKLYEMLKNGYRMEKPLYANDDIYNIILECWYLNPAKRPLFNVLKEKFAVILGEDVTKHYTILNEPYLRTNLEHTNLKDYLTTMDSPNELAPLPPRYMNSHIGTETDIFPNYYLPMIFSSVITVCQSTHLKNSLKVITTISDQSPSKIFDYLSDLPVTSHTSNSVNYKNSPANKPTEYDNLIMKLMPKAN